MDYGTLFVESFRLIWRQKKLWMLGLIGLALTAVANAIATLAGLGWQWSVMSMINQLPYRQVRFDRWVRWARAGRRRPLSPAFFPLYC